MTIVCYYNYHNSGHHPSSHLLFKTQHFGERILSLGGSNQLDSVDKAINVVSGLSFNTHSFFN
jgi:hypothetical protein